MHVLNWFPKTTKLCVKKQSHYQVFRCWMSLSDTDTQTHLVLILPAASALTEVSNELGLESNQKSTFWKHCCDVRLKAIYRIGGHHALWKVLERQNRQSWRSLHVASPRNLRTAVKSQSYLTKYTAKEPLHRIKNKIPPPLIQKQEKCFMCVKHDDFTSANIRGSLALLPPGGSTTFEFPKHDCCVRVCACSRSCHWL